MNDSTQAQVANSPVSLLRIPVVLGQTGLCRASLYKRVAAGLFVRPVKAFGRQRAGWPSNEVQALVHAHIAGASESDIAELVRALHERRHSHSPVTDLRAA
jgi:predicted DNA-binding transcriptional regulator AlpA